MNKNYEAYFRLSSRQACVSLPLTDDKAASVKVSPTVQLIAITLLRDCSELFLAGRTSEIVRPASRRFAEFGKKYEKNQAVKVRACRQIGDSQII